MEKKRGSRAWLVVRLARLRNLDPADLPDLLRAGKGGNTHLLGQNLVSTMWKHVLPGTVVQVATADLVFLASFGPLSSTVHLSIVADTLHHIMATVDLLMPAFSRIMHHGKKLSCLHASSPSSRAYLGCGGRGAPDHTWCVCSQQICSSCVML